MLTTCVGPHDRKMSWQAWACLGLVAWIAMASCTSAPDESTAPGAGRLVQLWVRSEFMLGSVPANLPIANNGTITGNAVVQRSP